MYNCIMFVWCFPFNIFKNSVRLYTTISFDAIHTQNVKSCQTVKYCIFLFNCGEHKANVKSSARYILNARSTAIAKKFTVPIVWFIINGTSLDINPTARYGWNILEWEL